jgi:hypothetical protein
VPILLILLLAILIATFGFWETLGAILGGIGVVVLLTLVLLALVAVSVALVIRRGRSRMPRAR